MPRPGILAHGAYLPRLRISRATIADAVSWLQSAGPSRARGERTFCNWDEDAVTMAVEATRHCLGSRDRLQVESLVLASTTLPFADRSNAGVVAGALDLARTTQCQDTCGSQRAATSALLAALERENRTGASLLVAADRRVAKSGSVQELSYGHGAAAMLVGTGDVIAEFLGGATLHTDFVDHYRGATAAFDYTLEERWIRDEGHLKLIPEAVTAAFDAADVAGSDVAQAILPVPGRTAQTLARRLGIAADALASDPSPQCGEIGVGHPLLRLAQVLASARPGDVVLVAGFGQGADAIVLRVTEAAARQDPSQIESQFAGGIAESHYTRFLSHCGLLGMEFGMRAERDNRTAQSASYRRERDLLAFVGGRCTACGTVQFPRSHACVNPGCRAFETQVQHRLADTIGRVKTFTEDWLAYSARPPLVYGNVALDGGGNVFIEFADTVPGELRVGHDVRFVFRIKDVDRVRGFHRYFWKATPVRI